MGKYYLNKLRQMGGNKSKPEPPKEPEQTVAEMVKEAKKGLDNMIRGFKREIMKIEMDAKQIKKDLEKAVKKGEPRTTQRIYAQNYLKKNQMINKYKGLEAKIEGVKISLANIQTTQALVETMGQMNTIMGKTSNAIDINNIQKVITKFNTETEKQNIIGEMVGDAMDVGDDDMMGDDTAADELIDQIAGDKIAGSKKLGMGEEEQDFNNELDDLKNL